jgi:UDPglucose 6-dehydrogenase
VVVKSTIPPGTTEKIGKQYVNRKNDYPDMFICFSPEFLTEANSFEDFKNQTRIIIGGDDMPADIIKSMFEKVFSDIPIVKTDSRTAEMVKYFINCFLATKVTFANQMFQICLDHSINYKSVVDMSLLDKRIGTSHLSVPGPDGDLGFGGHCFPKDLSAMIAFGSINNGDTDFLKSVQDFNDKVRMIRDWENMKGRAVSDD